MKIIRRLRFAVLVAASVALTVPADARDTAGVDRIRADVARLAADDWAGRRAGTPGGEAAGEWIAAEFRRIGLEPAGTAGSFFQPFTFIDGVDLGAGNRLSVNGRSFRAGDEFRPLAFSSAGKVAGTAV